MELKSSYSSGTTIGTIVCLSSQLKLGERIIFSIGKVEVGVFRLLNGLHALVNRCPHQGAPLCLGKVCGTTTGDTPDEIEYHKDGEILRCPWHAWEFDITSGKSIIAPDRIAVRKYKVEERPLNDMDRSLLADPYNLSKSSNHEEIFIIVMHDRYSTNC